MVLDLTDRPLHEKAFSGSPFSFLEPAAQNELANIAAISLIENGERAARESWQSRQLSNLLKHAHSRSQFWRQRMPSGMIGPGILKHLPIQSRSDVIFQTTREGALVPVNDNDIGSSYSSTGSTGTPVKVFVCRQNGYYNAVRSLAQYFINNLSLAENRVFIGPAVTLTSLEKNSLYVARTDSWAGPVSGVFRNGSAKKIGYKYDDDALIRELSKDQVGYLSCANRYLEILMQRGGTGLIQRLGVKLWLHLSDYRDPALVNALAGVGVPSLSSYSAGETGPIAFECTKHQGHFHVAHTNVIVETDDQLSVSFDGRSLGRLLVTHLHSYATPLIRYDIGDFGELKSECPCGHNGPTISAIYGRGKHFVRHPSGKLIPFYISTRMLNEAAPFTECRIRQNEIDVITVELGGRDDITAEEEDKLKKLFAKATDPAFTIKAIPAKKIDWAENSKRLFFASSVA